MPKGNSGIKRNGGSSRESPKAEASEKRTLEVSENRIDASSPDAIGELREMASRGEFPEFIESSSRESRERFYEKFDQIYPDPPGILNDYSVKQIGSSSIQVSFKHNLAEAESPPSIVLPRRVDKVSETVKRGAIKHAIYSQRPAVELALLSRSDGYASFAIAGKYGKRVLSGAEKAAADREMIEHVEGLLKSSLTREGYRANESEWRSMNGGWRRVGTIGASEL